jgi:histidinol-phosphate aminotransferase
MADAITERTKLVYLANPNNPTGTFFGKTEWEDFIQKVPKHVIVVLDEAYTEYVTDTDYADGLDYLDAYPNLLVSRTFSKAYGLAALRVGYMVGHSEVIGYINRIREPFNINHLAQVAAQTALTDQAFVKKTVELNQQGMISLMRFFDDMDLEYIPSQGNFICVRLGESAPQVNQALLAEGVIVRPVAKQGTFAEFLRVSIGLQKENSHFMDALRKILSRSA